jgi:hypothetical protein
MFKAAFHTEVRSLSPSSEPGVRWKRKDTESSAFPGSRIEVHTLACRADKLKLELQRDADFGDGAFKLRAEHCGAVTSARLFFRRERIARRIIAT